MAKQTTSVGPIAALVTGGLAVVAVSAFGYWRMADDAGGGPGGQAVKHLTTSPAYALTLSEMKAAYPAAVDELYVQVKTETAEIRDRGEREVRAEMLADRYVANMNYSSLWNGPLASEATLIDIAARRLLALRALRANSVNSCGRYAVGVAVRDRQTGQTLKLVNDAAAVLMRATVEGGGTQGHHHDAPTPADNQALLAALHAAGLNDADVAQMTARQSRDAIPRDEACKIGIAFYGAVATLPADARVRLMSVAMTGGGWGGVLQQ